jgi:hypothetical protein
MLRNIIFGVEIIYMFSALPMKLVVKYFLCVYYNLIDKIGLLKYYHLVWNNIKNTLVNIYHVVQFCLSLVLWYLPKYTDLKFLLTELFTWA